MLPAMEGNKIYFAMVWVGSLVSGGISILIGQRVIPENPASYIGLGAIGTSIMGLVVPIFKMWIEQRDKDRAAMMESSKTAAQLQTAFDSIATMQASQELLQQELHRYRNRTDDSFQMLLRNQAKFFELNPGFKNVIEQQIREHKEREHHRDPDRDPDEV